MVHVAISSGEPHGPGGALTSRGIHMVQRAQWSWKSQSPVAPWCMVQEQHDPESPGQQTSGLPEQAGLVGRDHVPEGGWV